MLSGLPLPPLPVSCLPVWILGLSETADEVRDLPQRSPQLSARMLWRRVMSPPNLALACVLSGEWDSASIAVCGEAEGCETEAPSDVVPKFFSRQLCVIHEAGHDCEPGP